MSMPSDRAAANVVDDVATELSVCTSVLSQLSAVFKAIADELEKERPRVMRAKDLADLGAYVAEDRSNAADGARERLEAVWADLNKAAQMKAAAVSP